jgi:hypothetical protein
MVDILVKVDKRYGVGEPGPECRACQTNEETGQNEAEGEDEEEVSG